MNDGRDIPDEFIPSDPAVLGGDPLCAECGTSNDHGNWGDGGEWRCAWCVGYLADDYLIKRSDDYRRYIVSNRKTGVSMARVVPRNTAKYTVELRVDHPDVRAHRAIVNRRRDHCSVCKPRPERCLHLRAADVLYFQRGEA